MNLVSAVKRFLILSFTPEGKGIGHKETQVYCKWSHAFRFANLHFHVFKPAIKYDILIYVFARSRDSSREEREQKVLRSSSEMQD